MRERSDEDLMSAFSRGSMEAFEVLYERHRANLYRYVMRKTGNAATANDLYQGAWEKVIKAREKYNPNVPFRAWLYRITHNHLVDFFRRARQDIELQPEHFESPLAEPEAQVMMENRAESLANAISQLPQEQKDVLLLKLEGGLSLDDIASVTGVNRETAKSRIRYATAKLKNLLRDT
jgi:RNA polymerase sigma-70 factor (ECF subfamily)